MCNIHFLINSDDTQHKHIAATTYLSLKTASETYYRKQKGMFIMAHDHQHQDHLHEDEHDHHDHAHGHAPKDFGRAFLLGVILNSSFVVAEAVYGILSNSLALLADAGHNLSDVLAK